MACPADDPNLASRRHITLILRLTLDQEERLVQGELVDTIAALRRRFTGLTGLNTAVDEWLRAHVRGADGQGREGC